MTGLFQKQQDKTATTTFGQYSPVAAALHGDESVQPVALIEVMISFLFSEVFQTNNNRIF
jgi:hypothetical protein